MDSSQVKCHTRAPRIERKDASLMFLSTKTPNRVCLFDRLTRFREFGKGLLIGQLTVELGRTNSKQGVGHV